MPQLDISAFSPQIIWLIITFCVLYVLMARVALPRIGNVLEQRQSRIDGNLEMAQNLRNESKVDAEAYDQVMVEAREQARKAIHNTVKEISDETTRRHEEINTKLSDEFKMAEDRISAAKIAAVRSIQEAAASVTSEAIERLIGERPEDNAVKKAISSAFEEANKGLN